MKLGGQGETDTIASTIEDGEVSAHESVSNNPRVLSSTSFREKTRNTPVARQHHCVVGSPKREALRSEGDCDRGQFEKS